MDAEIAVMSGVNYMKDDLESIIKQLERAYDLIDKEKYLAAQTAIYEAQSSVQFLKDNKA